MHVSKSFVVLKNMKPIVFFVIDLFKVGLICFVLTVEELEAKQVASKGQEKNVTDNKSKGIRSPSFEEEPVKRENEGIYRRCQDLFFSSLNLSSIIAIGHKSVFDCVCNGKI